MERPMSTNVVTQDTEFLFQFCGITYRISYFLYLVKYI